MAGRLALVFCAVAVFSTVSTLALQDRSLDRDLEGAARLRLERSARAAGRLLQDHLRSLAQRYEAVSRTPELRANLEAGHSETLRFFAQQLRQNHGASLVAFQSRDLVTVAWSGGESLARELPAGLRGLADSGETACIVIPEATPDAAAGSGRDPGYRACRHPTHGIQATLVAIGDTPYAVISIPLTTRSRRAGLMLVAEAVGERVLESWSALCGAEVRLAAPDPGNEADLVAQAARFRGTGLWVSSSLEPERLALLGSRRHLLFSGLFALSAALGASLVLARGLSRPLRAMQAVTERIRQGDYSVRLGRSRNDELGDLSRALDSMLDRLDEAQQRLRRVQRLARFGEWTVRFDTGIVEGSPEFARALGVAGFPPASLQLDAMLDQIHPEDRGALRREIDRCREAESSFEVQLRGSQGRILLMRGSSRMGDDAVLRLEGSVQDLTEQKRVEEQIRYLTYHSPVTGLPNMRFFRERLLRTCRRKRGPRFVVVFVDLDHFRMLNETHGHSFGDAVLRSTATRLLEALPSEGQEADSTPALAHLGGDEFALLIDGVRGSKRAGEIARALLERISRPQVVEGETMVVTASIGICFGTPGASPQALLRNCDSALHRAKAAGRARIEFFDETVREETSRRLRIDGGLRRALEGNRLQLHYQPRIAAADGSIACFEALLRWTDEDLGAVTPSEFIPVAEQSGAISLIGSWAIVEAIGQLRAWSEAGYERSKISINLSPHQFHPGIDAEIRDQLQGLDPRRLELEVTEYALLRDEGAAIAALSRLRDVGFRISLDDFGTGYSSLSYLRKLPLDAIKIDRSFIRHMDQDSDAAALIASIIAMARTLRLEIIAEGVETAEQRDMLVEMGCDELQGFYYSPAVPSEAALRMLAHPPRSKKRAPRRGHVSSRRGRR